VRIDLSNGSTTELVEIPDRNLISILHPNDTTPFQDTEAELRKACAAAAEATRECNRVLILVNDYTRPTPTAPILASLEPGFKDKELRILVCLGTHRQPSEEELRRILGADFFERHRYEVLCHDCHRKSGLFFKGKTRLGTEVWFNRELLWPNHIIAINSVEPHYYAGYTGGRKTLLPGLSGYDTICQNHGMVTTEGSGTFALKGNPVHEDMDEAARMLLRPVFSIQLALDRFHKPCSLHFGDLSPSFEAAARDCRRIHEVRVDETADVILSVLQAPYDINFYQSQRAVEFARSALKNPAIHIAVSACRDGIGNDGFVQVLKECESLSVLLREKRTQPAAFGWHKSARLAQIMETVDLYTVMGIPEDVVKNAFMHPFHSIQHALDAALHRIGPDARVYVVPDAGSVVPVAS